MTPLCSYERHYLLSFSKKIYGYKKPLYLGLLVNRGCFILMNFLLSKMSCYPRILFKILYYPFHNKNVHIATFPAVHIILFKLTPRHIYFFSKSTLKVTNEKGEASGAVPWRKMEQPYVCSPCPV